MEIVLILVVIGCVALFVYYKNKPTATPEAEVQVTVTETVVPVAEPVVAVVETPAVVVEPVVAVVETPAPKLEVIETPVIVAAKPKRAKTPSGKFIKDDPATPENEAWVGGVAPAKPARKPRKPKSPKA